jgi:hypothetical protein
MKNDLRAADAASFQALDKPVARASKPWSHRQKSKNAETEEMPSPAEAPRRRESV